MVTPAWQNALQNENSVYGQLLGRFLTLPINLLKICIRGQCEIFNFFTKVLFRKAMGVKCRPNTDFQQVEGGCRKYAQKLPNILKFQFYTGFAGFRAPYGPQVAA